MPDATDRFVPQHLRVFLNTRYKEQEPFNPQSPYEWAQRTLGIDRQSLARQPLNRAQVRAICLNGDDALDGYLTIMAWGMQGVGKTGKKAIAAWRDGQTRIQQNINTLRAGQMSRAEAFELFATRNPIAQLGPSYFTKILYFYAPEAPQGADRYIMDTWTGKAINLLTGEHIVRIQGESATPSNRSENYEVFCREVEALGAVANRQHPQAPLLNEHIERMLFCQGAQRGKDRGPWRKHVHAKWPTERPLHRYNHGRILARIL
ncbi:8-oxoguanine DNA glycosylase OGG fold protein [Achromobacter sp. KK8]|jgi:hypothetical protein